MKVSVSETDTRVDDVEKISDSGMECISGGRIPVILGILTNDDITTLNVLQMSKILYTEELCSYRCCKWYWGMSKWAGTDIENVGNLDDYCVLNLVRLSVSEAGNRADILRIKWMLWPKIILMIKFDLLLMMINGVNNEGIVRKYRSNVEINEVM